MKPHIVLKRFEYEEPDFLHLELIAANHSFAGSVDFYSDPEDLIEIGEALKSFPKKAGDVYEYVYGSDDPNLRVYRYLVLRTYTTDTVGHCAIQFTLNLNTIEPHEGKCTFSIVADAAAVNRLGELFIEFSKLQHLEFRWTPADSELFREHQRDRSEFLLS